MESQENELSPTSASAIIIVDIGTRWIRLGFSGEDQPTILASSSVGTVTDSYTPQQSYLGQDILCPLHPKHKLDNVRVEDIVVWDKQTSVYDVRSPHLCKVLEEIIEQGHKGLSVNPTNCHVLLCAPTVLPDDYRSTLGRILLEEIGVESVLICRSAPLTAFGCGRTTAAVLDMGYHSTTSSVVVEAFVVPDSIKVSLFGSKVMNDILLNKYIIHDQKTSLPPPYMIKSTDTVKSQALNLDIWHDSSFSLEEFLNVEMGVPKNTPLVHPYIHTSYRSWCVDRMVEAVKHNYCDLALDEDVVMSDADQLVLPDGTSIDTGKFKYGLYEYLYKSGAELMQFIGRCKNESWMDEYLTTLSNHKPVSQMVHESICASQMQSNRDVSRSIVMTGGMCRLNNFYKRLEVEMEKINTAEGLRVPYKVIASSRPIDRSEASWIGGSIFSCLGCFSTFAATRVEYDEFGTSIFIRKCPV